MGERWGQQPGGWVGVPGALGIRTPSAKLRASCSRGRADSLPASRLRAGADSTSYEIAIVVMGSYLAYLVAEVAGGWILLGA